MYMLFFRYGVTDWIGRNADRPVFVQYSLYIREIVSVRPYVHVLYTKCWWVRGVL